MATPGAAVLEPLADLREPAPPAPPARDGDGPFGPPPGAPDAAPPVSNARLGMLAFIVFESMLFVPLLGGYLVFRAASPAWPPAGQPYLPIAVTWLNTAVLLGSCVPLTLAVRAARSGRRARALRGLAAAAAMGAAFLAIQGFEWTRLVAHGMTVAQGIYGGIFVALIGAHGLHVLGAVVWLATVSLLHGLGRAGGRAALLELCAMYWYFVSILWIVLFALVYLGGGQ